MIKKLRPNFYFKSIYAIPMEFYKKHGITTIFADLDNTLVSDENRKRPAHFDRWYADCSNAKIKVFIVSNNRHKERVRAFVGDLPISWWHLARKQNGKLFCKLMEEYTLSPREVAVIGDRVTTDIIGGNRAKMQTILVAPIIKDKNIFIRFIRIFEKRCIPAIEGE
ncbi:hypothetical protein AwErysi_01310 [Erysipelotrichaceae bacterium]|nr:hypothetical protein AwErysi_01310 [Erysipelotrichaceae bacterium]